MRSHSFRQRVARVAALLFGVVGSGAVAFAIQSRAPVKLPEHFVVNWVGSDYETHEILDGFHTDPVWLAPEVPVAHAWTLVAGLREHQKVGAPAGTSSARPGGHVAALLIRVSARSKLQPERGLEYEVITNVAADGRSGYGLLIGLVGGVVEVRETIHFIE